MSNLLKVIIVLVIVIAIWKFVVPNITTSPASPVRRRSAVTQASGNDCVDSASHASEVWGGGIGRFANDPDQEEWSRFASEVNDLIAAAENECSCPSAACSSVRYAMSDFRKLVSDFDRSVREGTPPPDDAVQRQEKIDETVLQAGREN